MHRLIFIKIGMDRLLKAGGKNKTSRVFSKWGGHSFTVPAGMVGR